MTLYGIWSEERGWWFTDYTVFWTEHYGVALAQRNMLLRHFPTCLHDGSITIHYEMREMDTLVKELYGLVPQSEPLVKTEMQELRQRVAGALAEVQASHSPAGDREGLATPRGIQVGNIGAFEIILRWIDEIEEGNQCVQSAS